MLIMHHKCRVLLSSCVCDVPSTAEWAINNLVAESLLLQHSLLFAQIKLWHERPSFMLLFEMQALFSFHKFICEDFNLGKQAEHKAADVTKLRNDWKLLPSSVLTGSSGRLNGLQTHLSDFLRSSGFLV